MNMKKYLLTLIIILSTFSLHAQQAWTQAQGEGYFQVGTSYLEYSSKFSEEYNEAAIPRPITELILQAYGEFGITDKLTTTIIIPYHLISSDDVDASWTGAPPPVKGDLNAFGNINGAVTYNIYKKNNIVVSAKTAISFNTSDQDNAAGLRSGFNASSVSPTLLAGIGTDKFFASAETGVKILSDDFLPKFLFNAQIGKEFLNSKKLIIILGFNTYYSIGTASVAKNEILDGNAEFTALYLNDQSYATGNLKLGYKLGDNFLTWLSMGAGPAKNVGFASVVNFALGYKLKK